MITKEKLRNFIVGAVMGVTLLISGCGINETTIYTVPNWTPNGQIIARRYYMKTSTNLMSNRHLETQRSEVVVMNADGSGERALFADDENSISLIAMSPLGSYVAYIDSEGKLNLYAAAGGWHRVWDVVLGDYYDNIRFSPNERLLYVSTGRAQFKIYEINGALVKHSDLGGGGEFVDNNTIIFQDSLDYYSGGAKLAFYTIDSQLVTRTPFVETPYVFIRERNAVVSNVGYALTELDLDTGLVTTTNISYVPYESDNFIDEKISPDGQRLVMSYNSVEDVGIYVLDSVNGGIIQLR